MSSEAVELLKKCRSNEFVGQGVNNGRGSGGNSVMGDLARPALSISWNENFKLGRGLFSVVYEGFFHDNKFAVKKIDKANINPDFDEKKEDVMKLLDHLNVVKLYYVLHQVDCRCFNLLLKLKVFLFVILLCF